MGFGTLYGIGVGPGDPDLLTIKAAKTLGQVQAVFAAASSDADGSTALDIARPHLPATVPVHRLDFPITSDQQAIAAAWLIHAERVVAYLETGASAAFITLGDPLLFSTFGYLLRAARSIAPDLPVRVIPGITSFQAAAAATGRVLAEGSEGLAIVPCHAGAARLPGILERVENLALLKVYKKFPEIKASLEQTGVLDDAVLASRVGHAGEAIIDDVRSLSASPHYFSLILAKRSKRAKPADPAAS